MKVETFTEAEIRNIVYQELKKKDKIMNKTELKILIKHEISNQLKRIEGELFKIRRKMRELEEELKKKWAQ